MIILDYAQIDRDLLDTFIDLFDSNDYIMSLRVRQDEFTNDILVAIFNGVSYNTKKICDDETVFVIFNLPNMEFGFKNSAVAYTKEQWLETKPKLDRFLKLKAYL